ncbi:MAG: hypothetical protein ABI435_01905 [Pseudolysinimonas sp.]
MISKAMVPVLTVGLAALALGLTGCSTGQSTNASSGAPGGGSGQAASAAIDVCSLVATSDAASLTGKPFTQADTSTIATGQDQCKYSDASGDSMTVIVYQGTSGVSWKMMTDVLSDSSTPTPVAGVGDQAMVGAIELDVQAGKYLIAVEGGMDIATSGPPLAKAIVAALG